MDNSTTQNNELVSAVGRTMAVLEALAEHPEESGVSEIAQKLEMSKSTVYRFLQSLKARGYVVQDAEDRYRLSVRLFELGAQALPHLDIVREAEPGMRRINELTGETVHLGILDEGSIVYVHKIDSKYNLRMYSRIGRRAPLYCTGIGKVLMAWLEEDELLAHLQDHYALYGEYTGVRSARKHIGWMLRGLEGGEDFRAEINELEDADAQWRAVSDYLQALAQRHERWPGIPAPVPANEVETPR